MGQAVGQYSDIPKGFKVAEQQQYSDIPQGFSVKSDDAATPVQQESTAMTALRRSGLPALYEFAKGAGKGIEETFHRGGQMIRNLPVVGPALNALPSASYQRPEPPTPGHQQLGYNVERAAEFAVPATKVGTLTKGMVAPLRMIAQGGTAAGVGAAQGQGPEEIALTATLGGAGEALGVAWPMTKDFIQRKITPRMMNSLMGVKPQWLEYGRDPGGRIAKEGIVASSKDDMFRQVTQKTKEAGQALEIKLSTDGAGKVIDANDLVIAALDNGSKRIGMGADAAFQKRLEVVLTDIIKEAGDLSRMTPLQMQRLKSRIGDSVKWTGTPYEGDVNQVLLEIYRNLNNATEQAVPGAKVLLAKYGDFKVAENALKETIQEEATKKLMSGQGLFANVLKSVSGTPAQTGLARLSQIITNPTRQTLPGGRFALGGAQSQLSPNPEQRVPRQ